MNHRTKGSALPGNLHRANGVVDHHRDMMAGEQQITACTEVPVHPPIHPGEILADELAEIGVSQSELARALGVPRSRISAIIRGARPITADTWLRLSRWFGTSDGFWLGLEADYQVQVVMDQHADELATIDPHCRAT